MSNLDKLVVLTLPITGSYDQMIESNSTSHMYKHLGAWGRVGPIPKLGLSLVNKFYLPLDIILKHP